MLVCLCAQACMLVACTLVTHGCMSEAPLLPHGLARLCYVAWELVNGL